MREIKFRVWDVEKAKMIYLNAYERWGVIDHTKSRVCSSQGSESLLLSTNPDVYIWMQYTGLKDKNGKEIYEGDILREDWGDGYTLNIVRFGSPEEENDICGWYTHAEASFTKDGKRVDLRFSINLPLHWYTENEVIGNTWENPELLT